MLINMHKLQIVIPTKSKANVIVLFIHLLLYCAQDNSKKLWMDGWNFQG